MSKLSLKEELTVISARHFGMTYDTIKKELHHGEPTISRIMQPENLSRVIIDLTIKAGLRIDMAELEVAHYKKMFYFALGALWLQAIVNLVLFIL